MYDPDRYASFHSLVNSDGKVPTAAFLPSFQSSLDFKLNGGLNAASQSADMDTVTARQPRGTTSASGFPLSDLESQAASIATTATLAPTDTTHKPSNDQGREGDVDDSTIFPSPDTRCEVDSRSSARDAFQWLGATHLQFRTDVENALDLCHKARDKLSKMPTISREQLDGVWDVFCAETELSVSASKVTEVYDTYAASRARLSQSRYEEGLGDEDLTAWDDVQLNKEEFSRFARTYEEMRSLVNEDIEELRRAAVRFERVMGGAGDTDDVISSDPTVRGDPPDASRRLKGERDEVEIPFSQLDSHIDTDPSEPLLSETASEAGETTKLTASSSSTYTHVAVSPAL